MNIPSSYEHFLAHFLPGVMTTIFLGFFCDLLHPDTILKLSPGGILLLFLVGLFVGVIQDSIIFFVADCLKNLNNEDALPQIKSELTFQKYIQVLKESHFYQEFCYNSIPPILIGGIWNLIHNKNRIITCIALSIAILLFCSGKNYANRRNLALKKILEVDNT